MRKFVPSILLPLLLSLGCGYKVHVYGQPEVGKARTDMPPGASVHVELHPSAMPFADQERAAQRIEASLESRGFKLTSEKRAGGQPGDGGDEPLCRRFGKPQGERA